MAKTKEKLWLHEVVARAMVNSLSEHQGDLFQSWDEQKSIPFKTLMTKVAMDVIDVFMLEMEHRGIFLATTSSGVVVDACREQVAAWHVTNGGHAGKPASHALRVLNEVVELCLVAGASRLEILKRCSDEVERQIGKIGRGESAGDLSDELADVSICLDILAHHGGVDLDEARAKKLKILRGRNWVADDDGVLWREKE